MYQNAQYLTSVAELSQMLPDAGFEVAFIGRSNAGKSSALNTITNIKGLARTSKTPGRTQMINFFSLDDERRLVDLPGYGYAKAPLTLRKRWTENINVYLETRDCLQGLVVVMDVRHPLSELDQQVVDWAVHCELPVHVLLTKSDKLSNQAARNMLHQVEGRLAPYAHLVSVQLFSSVNRVGVDTVKQVLDKWFQASADSAAT